MQIRKRPLIFGSVVALAVVAAGTVWWWQSPGNVARAAMTKLGSAQTQKFTANLTIGNDQASQNLLGQQAQVQLILDGAFERKEDQRDTLAADVQFVTETEGITVRVEADARFIDDKAYVRVKKSPQAFPALVALKDQWLELPRGGAAQDSQLEDDGTLFAAVERTGTEKVGDTAANVYTAQATATALLRMLDSIADILGTRLTTEQVAGIRQSITDVDTVAVRLWVTPWSHQLVQLSTTLTIPDSNTITFVLKPTDRNQPVEIAVPEGALTLEGAVAGLQDNNASQPIQ